MPEKIKTVNELLAENQEKWRQEHVNSFVEQLKADTVREVLRWRKKDNHSIAAQFHHHAIGYEITLYNESCFDDTEEQLKEVSQFKLEVSCLDEPDNHFLISCESAQEDVHNSLEDLYKLALFCMNHKQMTGMNIVKLYLEEAQKENVMRTMTSIYENYLKKQ